MSKVIEDLPEKGVEAIRREPTSEESSLSIVIEAAEEVEPYEPPTLPFSKVRCIALVLTVTGASFINVSYQAGPHMVFKRLTGNLSRHCRARR